ncbi:redoxin domain-containing protein [Burkholderia sp. Ac-20365]|uniref:redoxin domain-containing protein n=1 Tax=Burkholderia sp. Ac-20365 TaxID=2703897 RepID=UPI00197B89C9|nr:redoxin domain-containing protein [Burkholderia sp. Ac-20365]MBN3767847.1 redoxin domain-containing protein [Burkholderia sp. Ac-20365]
MLVPGQVAPALVVDTLRHGSFDLASQVSGRMTLIYFYRGLHCPVCTTHLTELEQLTPRFAERGVTTIAISSDSEPHAREMQKKSAANDLRMGYRFSLSEALKWGLVISTSQGKTSIGIEDLDIFFETGVFLLRADRTINYRSVQSTPFLELNFTDLLQALDSVIKDDQPVRAKYDGALGPLNQIAATVHPALPTSTKF